MRVNRGWSEQPAESESIADEDTENIAIERAAKTK